MGMVAPVMSLASAGLSAAGSMASAQGQAQADQMQAQYYANAAEYGKIQAAQTGMEMTRNMQAMLGHIAAVRASVGSSPLSPSTSAVMDFQERKAEWERGVTMGSYFAQSRQDQLASQMYTQMGSAALTSGMLNAAGGLVGGLGGMFKSFGSFGSFGSSGGGGG